MDVQRRRGDLISASPPRLSASHVGELCKELAEAFEGTTVKDVDALPPADLVLVVDKQHADGRPGILRLFLSASPDGPRIHALHGRVQRGKGPLGPFFERVKSELCGARLREIRQVRGDRIVRITWDGPEGRRALLCELVGRHANLVLVDRTDRVLALLVAPPSKKEAPRLTVGETWSAPPGFAGGSSDVPALGEHLPEPPEAPPDRSHAPLPLSWRVEWHLGRSVHEASAAKERKRLVDRLTRRKKRTRSRLDGLVRRAEAAASAERVRQDAELLQANVASIRRGERSIELDDWFEEATPKRRIELDSRLAPQANVERLFSRYRKLVRDAEGLNEEREQLEQRANVLEEWLVRARAPELDRAALLELSRSAEEDGVLEAAQVADPRKRKTPPPRRPYRTFQAVSGSEIRVGRNAADNDTLTFRHARGNDLWLHTADAPGSHVILPLARGAEPDPEDILDAAHLAIHFSPLAKATKADVHVCRRKEVRKPKGAPKGLVHLSGGRTLTVRMQPDRLRRLLGP